MLNRTPVFTSGLRSAVSPRRFVRAVALVSLISGASLLVGSTAVAATYYVDPRAGSDANAGTSQDKPWATIPGTRNTANTALLRSAWGAIDGTAGRKIACGDTILLKGGASVGTTNTYSKSTVTGGGTVCIAGGAQNSSSCGFNSAHKIFFVNTCNRSNPITIRIASNGEWSGSRGDFTIDCAGMTPRGQPYPNDFDPCVGASQVSGLRLLGLSPTQRIEIKNLDPGSGQSKSGLEVSREAGATDRDIQLGWLNIHHHARGPGLALGNVAQVKVHDVELHNNGAAGFNCGMMVRHNCNGVGVERANIHDNAQLRGTICGSYGDAVYLQGPQDFWMLDSTVANNACAGLNVGAGNHIYPSFNDLVRVRDSAFLYNGHYNTPSSAGVGTQGGGDSVPKEGAPSSSPFDTYGIFQRSVAYGNRAAGFYVHHGSGFSAYLNTTSVGNATGINGAQKFATFQWNRVASDSAIVNSILVRANARSIFGWGDAGCAGVGSQIPAGCTVCSQRCTNAGALCGASAGGAQCTGCTDSAAINPELPGSQERPCQKYNGILNVQHSLLVPQGSNADSLSDFSYRCGTQCSNPGASCRTSGDCGGCAGGCAWYSGGSSFASPPLWLSDTKVSNKIGASFDPQFVAAPTACLNGTDYGSCNLALRATSPAVDMGTYYLAANGSGTNRTTLAVKQHPDTVATGTNFNGHLAEPRFFFKAASSYLSAVADTIQIKGATCADGTPALGAERAIVVSMTDTSIVLDRACSWTDGAGIALPWEGAAPDAGAFEFGGVASPTLISVEPLN